ncbi:hypothetical protein AVEN_152308-1, partial [Araneus ventricosus]
MKTSHSKCVVKFSSLYNEEGDDFLSRIITGDETSMTPVLTSEDLPV